MGIQSFRGVGQAPTYKPLQLSLSPAEAFVLPVGQGVVGTYGTPATANSLGVTMSGEFYAQIGNYSDLQFYDATLQIWRNYNGYDGGPDTINSDGTNYRIMNSTGCPIGAAITNAGSGLTNGFNTVTVTPSAGGSTWNTIVGGAINTTVTITAAGANYTVPPILIVKPPATQGSTPFVPATMTCTISGGAINAVTVVNQGAGYVAAPTVVVVPQSGDVTGNGGVLTVNATLAGSGQLTWMAPATNGTALTAVPTFTFSPASTIAATAIMNFTVTGYTVTTAGAALGNSLPFLVTGVSANATATATAWTSPFTDNGLAIQRPARIVGTSTSGGAAQTGGVIMDGGYGFAGVPTLFVTPTNLPTTWPVLAATVGGTTDTSMIYSL
jgi:hypothetical protein